MTCEEKLQAEKKQVKPICEYLVNLCKNDESLANAIIKKENNSVAGMFNYIKQQAKKEAEEGCAMIEDSVVYGWAREYWLDIDEAAPAKAPEVDTNIDDEEEEETTKEIKPLKVKEIKEDPKPKKETKEEAIAKLYDGLSLFDEV